MNQSDEGGVPPLRTAVFVQVRVILWGRQMRERDERDE